MNSSSVQRKDIQAKTPHAALARRAVRQMIRAKCQGDLATAEAYMRLATAELDRHLDSFRAAHRP